MSKREELNNIIYDVKMKGTAYFEADEESYSIDALDNGYAIESENRYLEARNLTDLRKMISKLGQNLLWL